MANSAFNSRLNPRSGKRERLSVDGTVKQFTASNYTLTNNTVGDKVAQGAMLQVVGADSIYFTLDGTDPSAAVGFTADPGDFIFLATAQQVKEFRVTQKAGATAIEALFMFGN